MNHYFTPGRRSSQYMIIADFIRGVAVEFEVVPGLFSYKRIDEGTKLLIEHADIPSEGVILDLGCGYGAIGITLAKLNPRLIVYMVDINKEAVRVAERNVTRNGLNPERVHVLHGNMYEPVRGLLFTAIYSNPPLAAGFKVIEKVVREAIYHLVPGGWLEVVVRKGAHGVAKLMEDAFGNVTVKTSKRGYKVLKSTYTSKT